MRKSNIFILSISFGLLTPVLHCGGSSPDCFTDAGDLVESCRYK